MYKIDRHPDPIRILGLMTGSSADGLDICLVRFSGSDYKPEYKIEFATEIPYPEEFQTAFRNPLDLSDAQITFLDRELGSWFAIQIKLLNLNFDVIASHGQTIKHEPPKFTLQIGDPSFMAKQFNVPVIYDFRTADIKQGGQGAPLIPIVDRLIFQKDHRISWHSTLVGLPTLQLFPRVIIRLPYSHGILDLEIP